MSKMGEEIKIEEFLSLSEDEIARRMTELEKNIPTKPGTEYLKTRLKLFDVQPWPFISYLAYNHEGVLHEAIENYEIYDGGENSQTIIEMLRERYILNRVLKKLNK